MQSLFRGRNFGQDSVDEMKNQINSSHEDFLKADDPEKKADALRYMCGYATQYLYLVPHDKKFIFKETERVLHQSAMNINDFDPREASIAFEYLSKYAQNIFDQPWRKDFWLLKLSSGFYVHNISSQLINAHEVLVAMGYVHVEENTLKIVPKLDEKRIKNVSRDMIVASQECLILSQIWQRVADQEPDYPLTVAEVFEFRTKFLGDTDKMCKTILSDIRRRNYEDKMQRITKSTTGKNFVPVDRLIDYEGMETNSSDVRDGRVVNEVEAVQKILQHTRLLHEKEGPPHAEEHIYDPVYVERSGISNGSQNYQQQQHYPLYPHHGNSAFVPTRPSRSVESPLIPKTVSSFNTKPDSQKNNTSSHDYQAMSSSSSLSSTCVSNNRASRHSCGSSFGQQGSNNHPLKFSKVPPSEITWPGDNNKGRQLSTGTTLNWSEFSEGGRDLPPHRRRHSERVPEPSSNESSRSRRPIMPNDVYPDDYFPVVKPTPIHSSHVPQTYSNGSSRYLPQDSPEEDMMDEALAYHSQVAGIKSTVNGGRSGWESDTRSISSGMSIPRYSDIDQSKISPTSPESSSWEALERSRGAKDHNSIATSNKTVSGSSSSSSEHYHRRVPVESLDPSVKPAASLNSLENVYYKQLLKGTPSDQQIEIQSQGAAHTVQFPSTNSSSTKIDSNLDSGSKPDSQQKVIINHTSQQPKIVAWSCRHCTFKNKKLERICEVCSKSKDFVEEEEEEEVPIALPVHQSPPPVETPSVPKLYSQPTPPTPPQIKPSSVPPNMLECPQCTLLNSKGRFECEACQYRLRNVSNL